MEISCRKYLHGMLEDVEDVCCESEHIFGSGCPKRKCSLGGSKNLRAAFHRMMYNLIIEATDDVSEKCSRIM